MALTISGHTNLETWIPEVTPDIHRTLLQFPVAFQSHLQQLQGHTCCVSESVLTPLQLLPLWWLWLCRCSVTPVPCPPKLRFLENEIFLSDFISCIFLIFISGSVKDIFHFLVRLTGLGEDLTFSCVSFVMILDWPNLYLERRRQNVFSHFTIDNFVQPAG